MAKNRGIIPRKIKGFRDIDPAMNQLRWQIIRSAEEIYQRYGFEHWDTPVLEYADCLGKYMPDEDTVEQGVYSFSNPEEEPVYLEDGQEWRDEEGKVIMDHHFLSLRYDLTAPLSRYYAEQLWANYLRGQVSEGRTFLFRRYQYGPVYRYEAKLDPGRFREFWQVDFDTVGTVDRAADAEVCMILSDALQAIGLDAGDFRIKVNNRKVLQGFLRAQGVREGTEEQAILRVIDKYDKIGLEGVEQELGKGREDDSGAFIRGLGLSAELAGQVIAYFRDFMEPGRSRQQVLQTLGPLAANSEESQAGLRELEEIDAILSATGMSEEQVVFDPTLVRGMAYYTGPIFEVESTWTVRDKKGRERRVGSICGGGRYDGLVEKLLGVKVPATGASIGVDRLAELLRMADKQVATVQGPVLITVLDPGLQPRYQKLAADLRKAGIDTEVYYGFYQGFRKLKKQLSYADKKNCPIAILIGGDELEKGVATVRNLKLGQELADQIENKREWRERVQKEVPLENLVTAIQQMLA